jgi:hypothetical protein
MQTSEQLSSAIETYIDSHGLQDALLLLSTICWEKAAHIEHNWQDSTTAASWSKAAGAIERVSAQKAVETVSHRTGTYIVPKGQRANLEDM